jgi:predicted metal-dependent peptidase
VFYGKGFFMENAKAQAAISIHEVLHVGLRHCQRGKKIYDDKGGREFAGDQFDPYVWNLAVDAIVNMSTFSASWVSEPSCGVYHFKDLVPEEDLKQWPAHTWSGESLYFYLMQQKKSGKGKGKTIQEIVDSVAKAMADIKNGTASAKSIMGDVMADLHNTLPENEADARNWNARITRAAAGERAGGILRNALHDLPETPTPWEVHLRRMVTASVMPTTELTMYKPSRHMLSKTAYANGKSNLRVPFDPGVIPKKGIKTIVVCVDTSGSIGDDMLKRFCAEIQQIRNKVGARIVIISCDAQVHQVIDIPRHKTLVQAMTEVDWQLKGGGGTDFRPAVAEAEKIAGVACIVYLTDMMGPYPEKCTKPLIWAATCEPSEKPRCGKVIFLRDV